LPILSSTIFQVKDKHTKKNQSLTLEVLVRKLTLVTFVVFALAALSFAADFPKAEIFGGYSYLSFDTGVSGIDRTNTNGWDASATYNFNKYFGVKADINGQYR
jgi:hypothetical protein